MRVRVIWLGRPAASPFEDQVETYRRRVARRWPAEDLAVRPEAGGRSKDPGRALRAEAASIRRTVPAGWRMAVLDEAGRRLTSGRFAQAVDELDRTGISGVAFVVGSDLGLDEALKREAAMQLSLSDLTLPHLVARLVLWEQLFRATDILSGGIYHRPS